MSALEETVRDATAGDPITGLRWMHKTTRKVAQELQAHGFVLSHTTVARLLHDLDYSLRTTRKRLARTHEAERDAQFQFMERQRRRFRRHGWPILSVDAKKKEWVGNFKNPGVCWRPVERAVLDHDFAREAVGRAIPYGVYDEGRNAGFVLLGISHETAEFAVAALRAWWLETGRWCYPRARRWLVEADCGGANSPRSWRWKVALQRLADELGVAITVSHVPPGASKWNRIEHRMFNLISANWAGEPLSSCELVLNHIRTTDSETGFRCRAVLDTNEYPTRLVVTDEEKRAVRIRYHKTLPQWNYTIYPHGK